MKKKRLFSRAAALAMAAILMVPSSIGTTVFAADASTETGAGSTEPEVSVAPEENSGADIQNSVSEETGTDITPDAKTGTETKTASEETEKPKETKKKQKYTATLEDTENGMLSFPLSEKDSIKADPENPAKAMKEANEQSLSSSKKYEEGSEVEIDAPAESGYTLEKIELTGKDGQKLQDLTVSEEGTVTFTMPEQDVAVKASFREWTEEEEESFDEELTEEELKESGLPAEEFTEEAMQEDAEALSDESAINMASLDDTASSSARLAGAKSIYLSVGGKCRYGSYLTHYFTTNEGQYAYCMNPMKKTPGDGWYTGYLIGNEDARKAFYYCYGGPGYSQFVNATGWIGDGSQQFEYAYSHVILSYMYATYALHDSGRANSAFHGLSTGTRNALINKANQMRYMASPPAGYGCYYFETGRQPIAFQVNNVSTLNLRKSSANPDITNGNPMYSLNGAQYGVYCDAGCTQLAATLTTDGNGNSNTVTLDPGTYYVKEYTAPQGYELDQTVKSIYLGNCDAKTITFSDEPINDPGAIEIQKLDKKTGENVQGIATLAGAQFTVNYYAGDYTLNNLPASPTRSWVIQTKKKTVNGKDRYVTGLMDEYKVGGQSFYYVGNIPTIPLGTITIQETKAPAGYNKDLELTDTAGFSSKNGVYLANIRKEGDITKLTGGQTLQGTDSYFRGDLVFKKVDGINDNPMADIPFKITNTDTGESHTIYTGSDGIYDSSKIKNSQDTNSDKNGAGVWFGDTDLIDDADGAFEYGSYTIEEISCAANKGKVMYSGSFVINGEKTKIDLGTIVNTSIEVSTTSYGSESETNRIQFDHKSPYYDMGTYKGDYATVLCDDINVKGLTSGYIVSKLVDKETGDFVKDENGSDLQATGKLIEYNDAAAGYTATGSITMPVKDVSSMLGKDYVFFTYIYELKSDGTPNYDNLLVSHTDMNDPQETVSFQNITTELTDSITGLHDLQSNGKAVTLKDKISLINFPSYDEINFYYIKYEGTLMDASGNPVTDSSGNPVKSTIACHQITKDELENGTSLTYDLSADVMKKYAGQKLTSYVQVYFSYTDPSVYENYIEWTAEKDLTNEDQSVSIPVITNTCVSTDNVSYTDTGIMDEVNMVGLIPGNVYTIQGKIVDRTTGKVISSSRTCTYGKDKYEITNVEPGKDGNYTVINADPYKVYHLKRAVSFSDGAAEGYYRLSDDGKDYVLCTESGKELEGDKIGKDAFEVEVLYPGSTFQEVTELSAVTTFTAGKDTAVKNVKFSFDPETLSGKSYVVTEDLYFAEKGLIGDVDGDDLTGSTVYAVLYDDGSMDFQKSKKTYASKVVTEIYRFDEGDHFGSVEEVPWYTNRNKVKSVSFKDKVSPESTAFLFGGMEYLTQISLDNLDTSNTTDMRGMFYACKGLKSLDVSKLDTSKVTDMGWMFRDCQNLTSLNVKNFDTSNVTDMNKMFAACKTLSSLDVTGFDTSNVKAMDCMFQTCSNLTNIDVSKFNTAKVKNMNWMFYQDPKLQSADLSNFDFSNVEKFGSVFAEDSALTKVVFPKAADWSKIEDLSYLFYQCGNLTSVTMPNACKTEKLTNTHAMFYGCSKLTAIDTSCLKTDLVTDISFMFTNCNALTALDVSKFHTSNVQDMQYMFYGCSNVSVIDVSGFDTAKVTNMQALFNGCSKVKILDVAGFDTSKVTDMQYMFWGCDSITTLDVSNFDTSNVTNMYDMFACAQLTALDCSSFNTSKVTNMRAMFGNCYALKTIDVSNFDTSNVTNMQDMFASCYKVTTLDCSSFDTSKVTNMRGVFWHCSGLKTIYVSELWSLKSVTDNGIWMFDNCTNLRGQSGNTYNGAASNMSMANYQTGYLTYKAASQKLSSNDVAKSVLDESIPLSSQSLDTAKSAKIDIDEKKAADEKTDEKGKHGWSGITKQIAKLISDHADAVYAAEPDNQTETKKQTPTLLYSHQSLSDIDETFYVPEIETSLTNGDGEHYFAPSADSKLTDTVSYKGLKPGITYVLTGQLMDKDAQEPAKDASGNNITGTTTFTPTASEGTVQVAFSFDGTKLGGKTLVAFETLSGYAKVYGTAGSLKTLAVHKDINDASQTVTNMGISTVAKDKASGSKQVTLSSKTTVTDTVSYKGAVAGYKYQLQAVLMDKLTGEAAVDGEGQPITGSKDFTASATSGSATVDLTFNGAGMPGGEYVVYETLYRITDNGSMEKWASHEDMNDEDQLVNVPGITTQLVDAATNTQFVKASSSVNAVDTVYYEGLIPGQSYTLTGQLIEKATGKVFVDGNGKEMTVTKTFTPAEKSGEVDVEFTLNATNLNTSSLVAYETLSLNGKEIVSERSLDNEYQTLSFPVITSTTAVDKRNGTKVIDAQDDMTIVDTISYTGMQTGLPLTVRSTVMDKATGKAAKDSDGNDIIVESEILPDETNGSIDVEIPIKGRNLMGKTLVVYEEICYADGVVIAQHKDLKDAGQTVTVAGITTTAAIQTTAGQNDRYTSQTVRDTVKYYGLTKGTSYTLQGTLMDKATGNAYQENGKDVTASKTFTASATSGTETLDFEISSSEAKNKTLVVCESVYTTMDGKQVLVAQHSDLTDKDQTVEVPDETVGKLKVTKTIQNGNKNKAFKFTITLKGSRIKDSMMLSGVTFTNGVGTISLKHGESKLIEDIPSGTTYRVVEEQSGLYRPIMTTGDAGTIEDGKTAEASFVNIHLKEEEPGEDEVNLTVSKKVLPEDAGSGEKFQFTAVFERLRANWNYGLSDETEFRSDADGKATVIFTLGKGENVTFLHLPAGCTYRFTEAAGAYTSSYAVTDAAGLQKIATASGANTEEGQEISTAAETADKGEKVTVTFTNEFQMSQDLTLTKKTVNADGSAYNAKEAFSFTVKFTGLPANAVISSTAGDVTADASGNAAKTISLKNGEQVIFHELPVGSKYQITESGSEYRPSYSIDAATVVKKTDRIVKRNSSLSTQIETIDKGENDAVTFTNERIVWYALPNTGSYMLLILIGTALIMLMIVSRKRRDYLSEK